MLLSAFVMLAGCTREDHLDYSQGPAIGFAASVDNGVQSRAVFTGNELTENETFGVWAYNGGSLYSDRNSKSLSNTPIKGTGEYSVAANAVSWASPQTDLNFYAYYPHTANPASDGLTHSSTGLSLSYTTPTDPSIDIEGNKDWMFANATAKIGSVGLGFTHALSRLAVNAKYVDQTGGSALEITSVTVKNSVTKGTYSNDDWDLSDTKATLAKTGMTTDVTAGGNAYATLVDFFAIPQSKGSTTIEVRYKLGGETVTTPITLSGDQIPDFSERGKIYNINMTITATLSSVAIAVEISVENWTGFNVDGDVISRRLNLSATEAIFIQENPADAESQKIYFWSDQPLVYVEYYAYLTNYNQQNYPTNVNSLFESISGSNSAGTVINNDNATNFEYDPQTGQGWIILKPSAERRTMESYRIYLNAGGLRKEIQITNISYGTFSKQSFQSTSVYPYVGAFWRAAETGERLIRIPAAHTDQLTLNNGLDVGFWTAFVGEENNGRDWIVLDTELSKDNNIWTSQAGDVIESDESYQPKTKGKIIASGNATAEDPIYFRIGLKSKLEGGNANAAPRYGTVYIVYGRVTGTYKITKLYVRQGEAADFVMTNSDAYGPNSDPTGSRTLTNRFLPYNLTAPEFMDPASAPQTAKAPVQPATNIDSYFTDYPTQGGAFYQWGPAYRYDENHLFAYHIAVPAIGTPTENWNNSSSGSIKGYWDEFGATLETCPKGYRRPRDMEDNSTFNNTGISSTSELRQSLWYNVEDGSNSGNQNNVVSGYYADGFFDRRLISTPDAYDYNRKEAVNAGNSNAAYTGDLFYNPISTSDHYLASLFFPAAGVRTGSGVGSPGSYGFYWTSSAYSSSRIWFLNVGSSRASNTDKTNAGLIRCVKDN